MAFAASDDDIAVSDIDEIAIEGSLAIDEYGDTLSTSDDVVIANTSSEVVTNDTFSNYFDESGSLLINVTADELEFDGDFSGVNVSTIIINKAIKFIGNNATFNGVSFVVTSDNVTIDGFTLTQNSNAKLFDVDSVTGVVLSNNNINYKAVAGEDSYAIFANAVDSLKLINNTIAYVGNTDGASINNVIRITGDGKKSTNIEVNNNKLNVSMPATTAGYDENYNSVFYSDVIVFTNCEKLFVAENEIDVEYNNYSGAYDSINVIVLGNGNYEMDWDTYDYTYPNVCINATVENNIINAKGHNFIYGISCAGEDSLVKGNTLNISSDYHYANGIQINGPSSDIVVDSNVIVLNAPDVVYGIYSYQWMGPIDNMTYTNNTIEGTAYAFCGMEIVENNPIISKNTISAYGNHTTGLAVNMVENGTIANNIINVFGSNVGTNSTGDSLIHMESAAISVKGDTIIKSNNVTSTAIGVNLLQGGDITLDNNVIAVVAEGDVANYALCVTKIDSLNVTNNDITFVGATDGVLITNGVYVTGTNEVVIANNNLNISVPSAYVPWAEVPAGSGNWVASPVSEGVVIESCDGALFQDNNVILTYNNVSGTYDTIYTVSVKDSDDVVISGNVIAALGHTYIYGIQINGDNFTVVDNVIAAESDIYYANGIDIEGPATGIVDGNIIGAKSVVSAYPIYSGMNGQNVSSVYVNNIIGGEAYNVFGMSLGDVESDVINNTFILIGNYTTGIAYRGSDLLVDGNNISLISSEQGNESVWEAFGVESVGIKVIMGNASIVNNDIIAQGKGVSLTGDATAVLYNNTIAVAANSDVDAYAIYAQDVPSVHVINNTVEYMGATQGTGINNAVLISNVPVAVVVGNKFNLSLVSSYVPWAEVPAGSGNWVSSPVSEGIVIESSDAAVFATNEVNMHYNEVVGSYDTIYTVNVKDSDNVVIFANNIRAVGHTYVYGIQVSGEEFVIVNNTIITESDIYYANGIDIEGPATGVVSGNTISAIGVVSAYPIYSGMNGQNVSAVYLNNIIVGEAYNVFGMSLGDVESVILNNTLLLAGNYTTGIAYRGSNLTVDGNSITLISSEQGNESVWEAFGVESVGIKVIMGNASIENNDIIAQGKGVSLTDDVTATVYNNNITVIANDDADAYAIYAKDLSNLNITGNDITYVGATQGVGINNAVLISNVSGANINGNKFNLSLVSSYVPWAEVPAGSGNWVSSPVSEGIVVDSSSEIILEDNVIDASYNSVVGSYDTLYVIDFKDSAYTAVSGNDITALGHTYIYGIITSGYNFVISNNTISTQSDNYYANGIDIEGPAAGVVKDNIISAIGTVSAYAIYSGMNGQNVSAEYIGNTIVGEGYNVFGMSLGDIESNIVNNSIALTGNYTTGIAYRGTNLTVDGNTISAIGSNVGSEYVWESFGVESIGIKVASGEATIINNNIETTGDYAIDVKDNNASVHDNYLVGKKYAGDDSVNNAGNSQVYNNTPVIENKTITVISITEVTGDCNITGVLKDVDGNPIANDKVIYSVDGARFTADTDDEGVFVIVNVGNSKVDIFFEEDSYLLASNATITLTNVAPTRKETAISFTLGDIVIGQDVIVNITASEETGVVVIILDGEILSDNVTLAEGKANFTIEKITEGLHVLTVMYPGDKTHEVSLAIDKFTVDKLPSDANITISDISIGKDANVTVAIPGATGNISVFVDGNENVIALDENGTAIYTIPALDAGDHSIVVVYLGDDTHDAVTNATTVSLKTYATSFTNITITGDLNITAVLVNALGNPIANATIAYAIGNVTNTTISDANGVFSFVGQENAQITISYEGNGTFLAANTELVLKDIAPIRTATVIKAEDYTTYAIDFYEGERGNYFKVQLVDANGNALANKSVKIGFNGVVYDRTTNGTGWTELQINLKNAGTYTFAVGFLGDDEYTGAFVVEKITVNKKTTSISASAKTFKASAKTKSYTVTLKTIPGSSINGKTYMESGKKVTIKVNGKTYSGKTNSKGQVTFSLKLTKKAKYVASINFAGDSTYAATTKKVTITIK